MKRFFSAACRGYLEPVKGINLCWSALFSCKWWRSPGDVILAAGLLAVLVFITPIVYLCLAPCAAFCEATKGGEE